MVLFAFIAGIITGIISIFLGVFVARTYFLTKIKATLFLFVLACSVTVNAFLYVFVMTLSDQFELIAFWTFTFLLISALISVLSICFFFEYIEYGNIRTNILFLSGILIGAFLAGFYFPEQLTLEYSLVFSSWVVYVSGYFRVVSGTFGILIIYRIIKGFFVVYRNAINERLKFQFKIIVFGFITGLIGLSISIVLGILIDQFDPTFGNILRGLYPVFISFGLSISIIGFNLNPYSIYLISQKVFQIIIFNKDGVTIFDRQFQPTPGKQATLITGAIYGISSMIRHALGIDTQPRSLKYLDRTILFEFRGPFGFALISDRDSRILRNGLKNFSDQFIQAYEHTIDKWDGSIKFFKDTSTFIKKSFPFLDVD